MATKDQNTIDGDPVLQAAAANVIKKAKAKKVVAAVQEPQVVHPANSTVQVDTVKGHINIKHPDGSEEVMEIPIKEVFITKNMVNVGMSVAATYNLGNYESAKVSVSLHVPCEAQELEETYAFIYKWVNGKMVGIKTEVKGQ